MNKIAPDDQQFPGQDMVERWTSFVEREPRTITEEWDLPSHVRSRIIVDVETDLL